MLPKTVFNKNQVHRHNDQQTEPHGILRTNHTQVYCSSHPPKHPKQQFCREFNTVSKGQGLRELLWVQDGVGPFWQCVSQSLSALGCSWTRWLLSSLRGVSMMHYSASRATHQCITGQSLQSTSALMDAKSNYSGDLKLSIHRKRPSKDALVTK